MRTKEEEVGDRQQRAIFVVGELQNSPLRKQLASRVQSNSGVGIREREREALQKNQIEDVVVRLELQIDGADPSEFLDFAPSDQ